MLEAIIRFRCVDVLTGIHAQHEVYEDLGIHTNTLVDPSFNLENFTCVSMAEDDPRRARAFDCTLSGSLKLFSDHARQLSSGRQSPYSMPGLTGSVSASPTSVAPATTTGAFDPISELACTFSGGPCYGENGEIGYAARPSPQNKNHWLESNTGLLETFEPIAEQQCTRSGDPLSNLPTSAAEPFMPAIQEKACTKSGNHMPNVLDFPSWDQLPLDFQNPTTSADYNSGIPISTTGASMSSLEGIIAGDNLMAWDDADLNFTMDMDLDLDNDLNMMGRC